MKIFLPLLVAVLSIPVHSVGQAVNKRNSECCHEFATITSGKNGLRKASEKRRSENSFPTSLLRLIKLFTILKDSRRDADESFKKSTGPTLSAFNLVFI